MRLMNYFKKVAQCLMFPLLILLIAMNTPPPKVGLLDLSNLENYANQAIPAYITKDNTPSFNPVTDEGATLGRVLFYDKNLSLDQTISCSSCHLQEAAFADTMDVSIGMNGFTERHSPRMTNLRFGEENKFFWDKRAGSLEELILMPIESHLEMGFSGANGQPGLDSLINRLSKTTYYKELMTFVYGDQNIRPERIQNSIAQFLRSIQSFDAKYDEGRSSVTHDSIAFSNFSNSENFGKQVFLELPIFDGIGNRIAGGAGCAQCHRPPEFDIDPNSKNNGETRVFGTEKTDDFNITRAPSLRDLTDEENVSFGGFMHNASMGKIAKIYTVINHYDELPYDMSNQNIDPRLLPNGHPQRLHLSGQEIAGLAAFLKTLRGNDVFTNAKWSNPFDEKGALDLINLPTAILNTNQGSDFAIYPNPANSFVNIKTDLNVEKLKVYSFKGRFIKSIDLNENKSIDVSAWEEGIYLFTLSSKSMSYSKKIVIF